MMRLLRTFSLIFALSFFNVSTVQGGSIPQSAYVTGFIGHAQGYAISCEARAAADWAGYWGVGISESEFLQELPYSANPDQGFVGDPNDVWGNIPPRGYGVHAAPVAATLRKFGLEAEAQRHLSWDDLRKEIAGGRPVIIWIIGHMWDGTPLKYKAPDGSTSIVAYYEHTMTLVGYGPDSVQVVDTSNGQYEYYSLDTFLSSWSVLGNMAVTGSYQAPKADEPVEPAASMATYTVQPGDHVMALARRFGVSWQVLAQMNALVYPFIIYPGQVLQLPEKAQPTPEQDDLQPDRKEIRFQVHLPMVQLRTTNLLSPALEPNPLVKASSPFVIFLP